MAGLWAITSVVGHVGEVAEGTGGCIACMVKEIGLVSAALVASGAMGRTDAFHTG